MKNVIAIIFAILVTVGIFVGSLNARTAAIVASLEPSATEEVDTVEDVATDFTKLVINSEPYAVTVKDGYDEAGVTAFVCDATAKYSFTSNSEDVSWDVYVLDAPFGDEFRYLNQVETAALSGNGELEIEEGQYIYLACSCNAFTADEPSDAILHIDFAE